MTISYLIGQGLMALEFYRPDSNTYVPHTDLLAYPFLMVVYSNIR